MSEHPTTAASRSPADILRELRARVEAATGADHQLGCDIVKATLGTCAAFGFVTRFKEPTCSLDAALALVERVLPGTDWQLEKDPNGFTAALIRDPPPNPQKFADVFIKGGKTPALALLSALLAALKAADLAEAGQQ